MSEEDAFLGKMLEQPGNDLTRLVYADWLDEQGTPDSIAKAEFLRLIADAEIVGKFTERAGELAGQLDPQWLSVVSKLPIENCLVNAVSTQDVTFEVECAKKWEELTPLEGGNEVRFCRACKKHVYYCHDTDDLRRHANDGNCVAVELGVPRRPGDLEPERFAMTMGMIAFNPDAPESSGEWPVEEAPRRSWWARLLRRERRRNQG